MKLFRFLLFILSLNLFVCCKKTNNELFNFDISIYEPEFSKDFSINTDSASVNSLITVNNPWQGAENSSKLLFISRDGKIPEGFEGEILNGEAKRIICMSSSHVAMLDAVDATDRIVGISGIKYINNPKIKAREKDIVEVGYEGNMNYEALVAANPDLVLLFSINGESTLEPKLKEFGIPFLYIGDYLEASPLGKAEWLIPVAETIGKRKEAIVFFSEIPSKYYFLKEKVAQSKNKAPKIMLNLPLGDSWFMPSTQSYIAMLINDAGADYLYKKNTGNASKPIDMEEAYSLVSAADMWLDPGTVSSLKELNASYPKFSQTNCVKQGMVFNNNLKVNKSGGNDCYESGVVRPDLILRDLIKIFHPDLIEEDFVYYQKLK